MEAGDLRALIASGETLTTEFKRGRLDKFNDKDLVEAVVCLALETRPTRSASTRW